MADNWCRKATTEFRTAPSTRWPPREVTCRLISARDACPCWSMVTLCLDRLSARLHRRIKAWHTPYWSQMLVLEYVKRYLNTIRLRDERRRSSLPRVGRPQHFKEAFNGLVLGRVYVGGEVHQVVPDVDYFAEALDEVLRVHIPRELGPVLLGP